MVQNAIIPSTTIKAQARPCQQRGRRRRNRRSRDNRILFSSASTLLRLQKLGGGTSCGANVARCTQQGQTCGSCFELFSYSRACASSQRPLRLEDCKSCETKTLKGPRPSLLCGWRGGFALFWLELTLANSRKLCKSMKLQRQSNDYTKLLHRKVCTCDNGIHFSDMNLTSSALRLDGTRPRCGASGSSSTSVSLHPSASCSELRFALLLRHGRKESE